ncbi:hypothetical protein [Antrihabitans stalactiti]|nr:hypothetical protein [Antrihabitans stalactiti]
MPTPVAAALSYASLGGSFLPIRYTQYTQATNPTARTVAAIGLVAK